MKEDDLLSHPVIIFDGYCNLCSSLIDFLIKVDKHERLVFIPFYNDDSKNLIVKFPELKENSETVILIYENKIYERSTALLKILNILGFPWIISNIFKIIPKKFIDAVYNIIALKRYSIFGKRKHCYIPIKRKK